MNQRIHSVLMGRALSVLALGVLLSSPLFSQDREAMEREGIELDNRSQSPMIDIATTPGSPVLLIPESSNDRVMAFDPNTGDLITTDYIPGDPTNLSTPIQVLLSASGDSFLISDQLDDVVQEYDLFGNYLGVFAPAGGANTAILDNIRGIALRANGNLLVTVGSGTNSSAVAEFDTAGNYIGNYVANGAGGLNSPFDVILRALDGLVGGISNDQLMSFDLAGNFNSNLAPINTFPEQIYETASGNILVGNFIGTQEGVMEFDSVGTLIGIYNPAAVGGNRGVYELPNGNILTTNGSGVHEIDRLGNLVRTVISGVSARFITYVDLDFATEYGAGCAGAGGFVPTLTMRGAPRLGNTVSIDIGDGLGGAIATYFASLQSTSTPIRGCTLLADVPFLLTVSLPLGGTVGTPGDGTLCLPAGIPNNPNLVGIPLFLQAIVADGAAPAGFAFTNGLSFIFQP